VQKEVANKADKKVTMQNIDVMNEAIGSITKEMLVKANL